MSDHKVNKDNLANLDKPERENYLPTSFIEELMQPYSNMTILDYGCGTGYFTNIFSSVSCSEKVFAVDVLPEAVEATKNRAKDLTNVEIFLSDETQSPLGDNIADVGITIFTLHEFDDRNKIIAEFKRMIKPSGTLIVIDWAPESPAEKGPPHHKRVSKHQAIEFFTLKGFSLVKDNNGVEPYCYTLIFKNIKEF